MEGAIVNPGMNIGFPIEWVKGALILALISSWAVIALFAYLNHHTRKPYLSLWMVAWMFYSVYLAASFSLQETSESQLLPLVRRTCLGISALFLFWGSLQRTGQRRGLQELGLGIGLIAVWNYVAVVLVQERFWCSLPMFVLLAVASVHSALPYLTGRRRSRGGTILGTGLLLWGLHLVGIPFLILWPAANAVAHVTLALLALVITVGIVMEEERTLSDQHYRTLFESAGDAIFLFDPETLQVLDGNRSAQELVACSPGELIGTQLRDICPDLGDNAVADLLLAVQRFGGEFSLRRHDGTRVFCEGSAHVVPSSSGVVLQLIARDTTQRRRWLQEIKVKSTAVETASNAIVVADQHGNILWTNQAFTTLTGFTLKEALGRHVWFLKAPGDHTELLRELWDTVVRGRIWHGEFVNCRRDGSAYTEQMTLTPVRDATGQITNFVAIKEESVQPATVACVG
jgi:PAS domain S-box-containing protein